MKLQSSDTNVEFTRIGETVSFFASTDKQKTTLLCLREEGDGIELVVDLSKAEKSPRTSYFTVYNRPDASEEELTISENKSENEESTKSPAKEISVSVLSK